MLFRKIMDVSFSLCSATSAFARYISARFFGRHIRLFAWGTQSRGGALDIRGHRVHVGGRTLSSTCDLKSAAFSTRAAAVTNSSYRALDVLPPVLS
jgi:hypothetical protein